MEKPGWGVVSIIVTGMAVLAFFLVLPNKDDTSTDERGSGPTRLSNEQTRDMARDTMKVVDGTENKEEIVRGSANPASVTEYDPTNPMTAPGDDAYPRTGSSDNNLSGYLSSLASDAPRSLFESINSGDFAAVQNILDSGQDVDQRDQAENTVLHHAAAIQGSVEIGAFLIRYGADVNAVNGDGKTPLDVTRSADNPQFEQLLLAHGARPGTVSETRPVSTPE